MLVCCRCIMTDTTRKTRKTQTHSPAWPSQYGFSRQNATTTADIIMRLVCFGVEYVKERQDAVLYRPLRLSLTSLLNKPLATLLNHTCVKGHAYIIQLVYIIYLYIKVLNDPLRPIPFTKTIFTDQ